MKQIKQILLIFFSTSRKILNGFDERKVLKQSDSDIEYGIIHGNSTIVFIKAGLLGSYRGYKNKYLKIAKRLNRNHGCTVITASNPNGYHDDFDSEMKFLKDYAYQYNLSDYQIYYMGHSNGASLGIIHAYKYPEIKKLVCINGPLNINLLSLTSGIRKFRGEKMNLVYCYNPGYFFIFGKNPNKTDEDYSSVDYIGEPDSMGFFVYVSPDSSIDIDAKRAEQFYEEWADTYTRNKDDEDTVRDFNELFEYGYKQNEIENPLIHINEAE